MNNRICCNVFGKFCKQSATIFFMYSDIRGTTHLFACCDFHKNHFGDNRKNDKIYFTKEKYMKLHIIK